MAVHPFHRIGSGEGKAAGQYFVKRDAKGIKITTRIDGTIHASGLFRCHVGQGSSDELGCPGGLSFARKTYGYSKTSEPSMAGSGVDKEIRGFQIFVDHRP